MTIARPSYTIVLLLYEATSTAIGQIIIIFRTTVFEEMCAATQKREKVVFLDLKKKHVKTVKT